MKKVLITGGNSGLGLAVTKRLLKKDYEVIVLSRDESKLEKLKNELNSGKLQVIQCDLRNPESINEAVKNIDDLDILINNAGIISYNNLEDHEIERAKDVIDTNLTGMILLTRALLPVLKKQESSIVLNVSSTSGLMTGGHPDESVYIASKFGVTGFTEALKKEMIEQRSSVRVLGFYPGGMDTKLFAKSGLTEKDTSKYLDPREVAEIIVFMLERSSGVNMDHVVVNRNKAL